MYTRALKIILLACCLGCQGGQIGQNNTEDDLTPTVCTLDSSVSATTAFPLTFDQTATDPLCPNGDMDYWAFTTAGDNMLLHIQARYEKFSNMTLTLEVFDPNGNSIGRFKEDTASGTVHRIDAQLFAATQGLYTLKIWDVIGTTHDPSTSYTLNVSQSPDKDLCEPFNSQSDPCQVGMGATQESFLSYQNDVDWFQIDPGLTNTNKTAIITLELSWPQAANISPTWEITQGTVTLTPTAAEQASSRTSHSWKQTRIGVANNEPISVSIKDASFIKNAGVDTELGYSLTVNVTTDSTEDPTPRNDLPSNATITLTSAPAPTIGTPNTWSSTAMTSQPNLVALGDVDWYVYTRANTTENSLLNVQLKVPAPNTSTAGYLLQFALFRISISLPCAGFTLQNGTCITQWFTYPSPDAPTPLGDFKLGGYTPNQLEAQVPLQDNDGTVYIRVQHVANADPKLQLPGFGTTPYTLALEERYEPDQKDREAPDNLFIARPLQTLSDKPKYTESNFKIATQQRALSASETASGQGQPMAVLAPHSKVIAGDCNTLTFDLFDAQGLQTTSVTPQSITLAANTDLIAPNCTDTYTAPINNQVGFDATSVTAGTPVTLNATISGSSLSSVPSLLPVVSAQSGDTTIGITGNRAFATNAISKRVTIELSHSQSTDTFLLLKATLATATTLSIMCDRIDQPGACAGADEVNAIMAPTPACVETPGNATCGIMIPAEKTTYSVYLSSDTSGLFTLDVSVPAPSTPTIHPARFHAYVHTAARVTVPSASGHLSYIGDQDFFQATLSTFNISGRVAPSITVRAMGNTTTPSPVEIRASLSVGTVAAGSGGVTGAKTFDICDTTSNNCPGTIANCDTRGYCTGNMKNAITSGVSATNNNENCVFADVSATDDTLNLWVNDHTNNDWDTANVYRIDVTLTEGCPLTCNPFFCWKK